MTNEHVEEAESTGKKDFNFKVQFVRYEKNRYVEIVPVSKKYFGKVVKSMALKFKDEKSWLNFLEACANLETWIKENNAWERE